jgi:hypothetical protein
MSSIVRARSSIVRARSCIVRARSSMSRARSAIVRALSSISRAASSIVRARSSMSRARSSIVRALSSISRALSSIVPARNSIGMWRHDMSRLYILWYRFRRRCHVVIPRTPATPPPVPFPFRGGFLRGCLPVALRDRRCMREYHFFPDCKDPRAHAWAKHERIPFFPRLQRSSRSCFAPTGDPR